MNPLLLLCTSLGLGTLSGVNLYLATCMAGAAIRWDFLHVHDKLQGLDALANPWVIGISASMYCIELVADKIPGVDSLWDAVHTFIRPIGAMALTLSSLGSVSPEWSVIAALMAGTASATTHVAKMGTRLLANASPEPVSNVVLSTAEDAVVITGGILLLKFPYAMAGLCLLAIIGLWFLIPKIFRKIGGVFHSLKNRFSKKAANSASA